MKNIVLIGMPGCGKSTIGKKLARRLEVPFYDIDEEIVKISGKSIPELFSVSENHFRDKETEAAKILAEKTGSIISCGGGIIKRKINLEYLRKTGYIVFLNRSPENICAEVRTETRPLLSSGREKVFALYRERINAYVQGADYIVDVEEPFVKTIPKIIDLLQVNTEE